MNFFREFLKCQSAYYTGVFIGSVRDIAAGQFRVAILTAVAVALPYEALRFIVGKAP